MIPDTITINTETSPDTITFNDIIDGNTNTTTTTANTIIPSRISFPTYSSNSQYSWSFRKKGKRTISRYKNANGNGKEILIVNIEEALDNLEAFATCEPSNPPKGPGFGPAPYFAPMVFGGGQIPTSIQWGTPPIVNCTVTIHGPEPFLIERHEEDL